MTDVLETLKERGFVHQLSDEDGLRQALQREAISVYCGYDPTAPSLHMGHLVSLMMLAHLQRAGHRPIVVVGGGTGMIGDPSGKTETRQLLSTDEIAANMEGQRRQFSRYIELGDDRALMLNNADWLLPLGYVDFLRTIGRYFSINQLLQHSTYRERLDGEGLNFIELNYALLQAYDFLHLYRSHGCRLQIGGADQWFNILAGTELIRRREGGQAFALVAPLILTAAGEKMGKTVAGALWLDPARTSPYDYYQYWINVADADVARFLKLFTFLTTDQISKLTRTEGAGLRHAKEVLAFEATALTHGSEAASAAQLASRALFSGEGDGASAPTTLVAIERLLAGISLADVLVETGLAASKSAARDLIRQGGAYVNGERVLNPSSVIGEAHLHDSTILLRAGRKRFHRLTVTSALPDTAKDG
jgi:tyrosyl-tRNA synthetase